MPADLDTVMAIQDVVHVLLPERREVFADKMRLFGEGCLVLAGPDRPLGYAIAHPWRIGEAPPLDTVLGALPEAPDCLFIHDVALLPEARGRGAAAALVRRMAGLARDLDLGRLALVSVYGTVPIWEACGFEVRSGMLSPGKLVSYGASARYMTAEIGGHAS